MPAESLASPHSELMAVHRELEAILDWPDEEFFRLLPKVSGWAPVSHVHHVALVNRNVALALTMIESERGVEPPGESGRMVKVVLEREKIPRGQVKAPEMVAPPDQPDRKAASAALSQAGKRLEALAAKLESLAEKTGRVPHPILGPMSAEEWLRFARVHSRHHLDIISDIRRAAASSGGETAKSPASA
jgi:hypothetical protein